MIGKNGAGKTTFFKIILQCIEATSGFFSIDPKIGYCPQNDILWDYLTAEQHIKLYSAVKNIEIDPILFL